MFGGSKMRNRNFRRMFGIGRGQMAMLQGVDQFGRPRRSFSQGVGRNQGDKPGSGPGGNCVCPECGAKVAHTTATPCNQVSCPKCGATMTKE